jgi:hypothetical protein
MTTYAKVFSFHLLGYEFGFWFMFNKCFSLGGNFMLYRSFELTALFACFRFTLQISPSESYEQYEENQNGKV